MTPNFAIFIFHFSLSTIHFSLFPILYQLFQSTVSSTRFASSYAFLSIAFIVPSTSSNFNVKHYTIISPPISATTSNPHLCQAYPFNILCRHLPQFLVCLILMSLNTLESAKSPLRIPIICAIDLTPHQSKFNLQVLIRPLKTEV